MTTIGELRTLLLEVPDVLIDVDDTRVLADAITSLDALEGIDVVPSVIAFVGSSGSGKSALVNAVLGVDATETGVLRPTTLRPLMVGGSGPVSLSAESEYLHLPDARPGILVIVAVALTVGCGSSDTTGGAVTTTPASRSTTTASAVTTTTQGTTSTHAVPVHDITARTCGVT